MSTWRNVVLVLLLFATLVFSAFSEGYQSQISLPFALLLVAGLAMSLWVAVRTPTVRLLALLLSIFFIEYVKETIGIKSHLWTYHQDDQYLFGVLAWVVAGTSAYGVATTAVIPVLERLGVAGPRWLNSVVLLALFAVIPLRLGPYFADTGPLFWSFYGVLLATALLAAPRTPFPVFAGLVLTAWVLGAISEFLGSASGIWTFTYNPDYPPLFLVAACWPLEIFVQYALSRFLACELPSPVRPERSPERALCFLLILSGVAYFVVGFGFALVPTQILVAINRLSQILTPFLAPAPLPRDHFWVALAFSMMMTITALCFLAARDVRSNKGYVVALLISKAASALCGLAYFVLLFPPHLASLASLAIFLVDGSIFCITLFFFLRFIFHDPHRAGGGPPPNSARTTVAAIRGKDKLACLHQVLAETHFFDVLESAYSKSQKKRDEFSVVIKPNFMFMHAKKDQSTYTDPELVEELVNRIAEKGFTRLFLVEAQSAYGNYYGNRDVVTVAEYVGYSPNKNYRIVDLTKEMDPHDCDDQLGRPCVAPTWRDADFRISFAKNKTHMFSNYTLTLKNIYGTFPEQNKLKVFHSGIGYVPPTIEVLKQYPVHFGLIDAFLSADGQFGVIADPTPPVTETIIGGENLIAVDWVGATKMGLDPDDPSVGGYLPAAMQAFGRPEIHWVGDQSTYEGWHHVFALLVTFVNFVQKWYSFSDWWFSVLTAMDAKFPFMKTDWPTLAMRKLLAPVKRWLYPYDVLP